VENPRLLPPFPSRQFKRINEWGMGVGIAGISISGVIRIHSANKAKADSLPYRNGMAEYKIKKLFTYCVNKSYKNLDAVKLTDQVSKFIKHSFYFSISTILKAIDKHHRTADKNT
jgi:hypothetical protein